MNNDRVRLPRKLVDSGGTLVEEGRLHPVGSLNITLNLLPLHRVSMTLPENDLPLIMHDYVEVYNQNGSVGIYRVTKITNRYRKQRKYELSHVLDVFSDAELDTIEKYSGTVAGFLQKLVNAQTQTIGGVKCWQLGTVEDTNPWNKDIKHDNAMECLTDIAKTEEDYMFTFDTNSFPWTLNFIARDNAVLSEFRLCRNIENCTIDFDDANQCTRLSLSVTTENKETITDKDGVSHELITTQEGYYTYDDAVGQADWGPICKSHGVNRADVPTPEALQAWVNAYFDRHRNPGLAITIDGVEINRLTRESIDEAHLGRLCRAALSGYSAVFNERIVSINYPDALRAPSKIKASLSSKRQTAEGAFSELKRSAGHGGGTASSAKKQADNNDAEQEKQKIIYDLQVKKDEKRFAVIATESWYETTEAAGQTLVGIYNGQYEVTARKLTSAFSVTGVQLDANGNPVTDQDGNYVFVGGNNSLSSQVTQTAAGLTTLYQKTGVNSLGQSETLYSKISQNAQAITTKVSAGDIASTINQTAQSVLIQANKINLQGYVTASQLDAVDAKVGNLVTGAAEFVHIKAAMATILGNYVYWRTITAGNKSVTFLSGDGADMALAFSDFPHSHAITMSESDGVVTATIGAAQATEGSANFNIADTTFYKNAVSAANTAGKNSVTLSAGGWTGPSGTNTVTASNGKSVVVSLPAFTSAQSAWTASHKKTVSFATASVSSALKIETVDASDVYASGETAGAAGVSLADPVWGNTTTDSNNSFTVTASNGESKSQGLYLTAGSWSSGSRYVYMRTGSSSGTSRARLTVSMPAISDASWSWSNPAKGVAMASVTIGGRTYSNSHQIPSSWM